MLLRLGYLTVSNMFTMLRLLPVGDRDKDVEILALRLGVGSIAAPIHCHMTEKGGYFARAQLTQNLSAVTAACLVMRKSVFEEIGGFDEVHLPIAFNDVDLCLRLRERNLRAVWSQYAD